MYTQAFHFFRQVISRLFVVALLSVVATGCCVVPLGGGSFPSLSEDYEEKVLSGEGKDKILVVPIEGVITDEETAGFFGPSEESMVAQVVSHLNRAREDESVKAVILKINSPGGGVTASDIIYREIQEFKKERNIPVVAVFMDIAASGGYYVAMAADRVYAHPTTITGSIGVIFGLLNVKEGLEKIGIKDYSITSGENKAIGSPTREMTEEQRQILQSIINDMYGRFVTVVDQGRPNLNRDRILKLADGRIYTANQAKENGLVDDIGYFDEFVRKTMDLPNYRGSGSDPRLVLYTKSDRKMDNIYQTPGAETSDLNRILRQLVFPGSSAKFYFLWNP
ncbi:MAG TPA: signal peptide peptidase SppA [Leptospiraceae bacterium]|nr:signal peptide peptidase SppA [Spirochaetaceae bacterium]HBS06729.1 signal peptide peptidase SppA [Leptospiraceae bacterium]|tara:strand:- start:252710 stop:253720 length:1011 start_codon:yes stop_codon:yes gene_type:complete